MHKKDGKILGAIDVRHKLSAALLETGGNIGYGVAPSERRKGYATYMLKQALLFCKRIGLDRALITCDKCNVASSKTIQKCGGILENEVPGSKGTTRCRYWINITE